MEEMGEVKEEIKLPPGFRFHPTDEELITFYLVNKISDANYTATAIGDVDLNKCEPWDLPGKAKMGEKERYFFSLQDRKYPTGVRTNRATKTGYWKTTGKDKEIYNSGSNTSELVGMRKTLVFYRGRAPRGEKSYWVMHEYRINSKSTYTTTTKDEWVVCRVFRRNAEGKKYVLNPSRAVNPHTYNLEIAESSMQSQIVQSETFQFPTGRNWMTPAEIEELNTVFRGNSQNGISLPIPPPQINCCIGSGSGGVGGCTASCLNLNSGGVSLLSQPFMREIPPPPPGMNQQNGNASMLTVSGAIASDQAVNHGGDMNNRFMGMEHCADFEHYWSTY